MAEGTEGGEVVIGAEEAIIGADLAIWSEGALGA